MNLFYSLVVITLSFEVILNGIFRSSLCLCNPIFIRQFQMSNCKKRNTSRVRNTLSIIAEFDMDVYLTLNCRFFLSLLYNFLLKMWVCMDLCMILVYKNVCQVVGSDYLRTDAFLCIYIESYCIRTHTEQPYTTSPSDNILKFIAVIVSYNKT